MTAWIPWTGEDRCPIPEGARFEVRYRADKDDSTDTDVIYLGADRLRWTHTGSLGDILAYRVLSGPMPAAVQKGTNPKDAAAVGRVPLHMVPDTLGLYAAMGFAEGDSKYIAYNFRVAGVRASVYVSALRRHLARYFNGEWADKKTRVPHLASVAACTAILIDGHVTGLINDDRPPAVDLNDETTRAEEIIKHVYEINRGIRPTGVEYTINTQGQA